MMQTVGTPQYYPQAAPTANAVNIQIFEPKAYAAPQTSGVQNPIYSYPQQSMYNQQSTYPSYVPQQPVYTPVPQYQTTYPQAPAQQQAPESVIEQQGQQSEPVAQFPTAQPAPESAVQPQPANVQPQAAPNVDVVEPNQPNQTNVDVQGLISGLQSTDNKTQEEAITSIASLCQADPVSQSAVLDEGILSELARIAGQDTSALEGPSEAQIAAINKAASGAQLTPEEQALTQQLAPKTAADKNRVISMFTLAMLQKNQRDEIDKYNQSQDQANQLPQVKVNDLIGYNEIEKAARGDSDKEVKLAALQALTYVARPEDKETLEPVLLAAAQDNEPLIKQAAAEALKTIGSTAIPEEKPQVDVSKMSRKERKAYKEAQKQAKKEAQKETKETAKA